MGRGEKARYRLRAGWPVTMAGVLAMGVVLTALPAAGAATSAKPQSKVVLRFMNWWDADRETWMNEVIRRFEALYPWIDVRNEVQGWPDRSSKIMAAFAAGVPAELTMVTRSELAALADLDAIIPITPFLKRDNVDLKEFFAAEIQAFMWDGEIWSLPLPSVSGEGSMYFFNQTLFEEAGLDPAKPPLTWRTLAEALRKLTRFDPQGRIRQLGMDTHPPMVVHFTYVNGGQVISDDRRRALFDSERAVEALRFVASDLTQKAQGGAAAMDAFLAGAQPVERFVQGKQAIISGHPSVIVWLLTKVPADFRWGVMPAPYNDLRPDSKSRGIAGFQWGWGYAIPKNLSPEKQEAAWLFLKFITMDERGAGYFLLQQGRPASIRRFNLNPDYLKKMGPNWPLIIKYLDNDVAFPVLPVMKDIYDTVINGLWSPLAGAMEPDVALQRINESLQKILDDYWARRSPGKK